MKTAILPTLRVEPSLRKSAVEVLREGETLSSFVEEAVQRNIEHRRLDAEFLARGLRHRAEAQRTHAYRTPAETLAKLEKLAPRRKRRPGAR